MKESLVSINAEWYGKYCKSKRTAIESALSERDIAEIASTLSYRASITRALYDSDGKLVGFKGKDKEKKICRAECEKTIADFLVDALEDYSGDYNTFCEKSRGKWQEVRASYHSHGITWYTFGNAQKWVAMAIKYFVVMLIQTRKIGADHPLVKNCLFPVDGIMIQKIRTEFGVSFEGASWSKCDCPEVFMTYISTVKEKAAERYGYSLFEYELDAWSKAK